MNNLEDYIFTSDAGDEFGTYGLADDEVAENRCQELANEHDCHVTCFRLICDCESDEE
jgi:hypothetical protein